MEVEMDIKQVIDPSEYACGVIVARFQVHKLHEAHKALIDKVSENHKKIIVFLGISNIQNAPNNPLDFQSRKEMIQEYIPTAVVLPIKDNRSNSVWSSNIDGYIRDIFADNSVLLYGSRDSFIPYYEGKYSTTELTTNTYVSGTEIRNNVSKEILASSDFRAGIIHANYAQRPVSYPTVDIVMYKDSTILLAKKPNEPKFRFIGGFVDTTDKSLEMAAIREFNEETGGNCTISRNLRYVTSMQVDDWRYRKEKSKIMTTMYVAGYHMGYPTPSDDISVLEYLDILEFDTDEKIVDKIQPEHVPLMRVFISKLRNNEIDVKNLQDKLNNVNDEV